MATEAHPALTCRVRWRRPGLRCRSQATMLLFCGVISTVGQMLACAAILCHLRHTCATRPALETAGEQRCCTPAAGCGLTSSSMTVVGNVLIVACMELHLSLSGSCRKIAPSMSSPSEFKVFVRGAAMCAALQLRFKGRNNGQLEKQT